MNESLILSIRQGICPGSVPEITGRCCNSLLRRDRCRNHIKYRSRLQLSLCPEVEFCSPAKEYDSRSHWRKIRSAGKLSGNCFFGRRTRRKPWAAAGPILSVLPERSALLRRLPRPKPILISSKQPRREMARSSPKYTVLNNPVGKKLVKLVFGEN